MIKPLVNTYLGDACTATTTDVSQPGRSILIDGHEAGYDEKMYRDVKRNDSVRTWETRQEQ